MFIPSLHVPNSQFLLQPGRMNLAEYAEADIAVIQRLALRQNLQAVELLKKVGLKVVYDMDDNLWEIPSYNPGKKLFEDLQDGFAAVASACDVITVSTAPIKDAIYRHNPILRNKRIEVVPNAVDFDYFRPRTNESEFVTIGWGGSNTHAEDVRRVFNLFPEIIKELPNVRLELVNHPVPTALKNHPRVYEREFVAINEYAAHLTAWAWDIFIAPLEYNRFNSCKSNIKMLEAAAIGSPILVSDVQPYFEFCSHDAALRYLICKTEKEWKSKMIELVREPQRREHLVKKMRRVAREHYDIRKVSGRWSEVFRSL